MPPGAYVETERLADRISPLVRNELFRHFNPRSVAVLYTLLAACVLCIVGLFIRDLDRRRAVDTIIDRQQAWVEVDRTKTLEEIRADIVMLQAQSELARELARQTVAFEELTVAFEELIATLKGDPEDAR